MQLNEWALSKMEGVEITARDGLVLTAYLTSPDNDRAKSMVFVGTLLNNGFRGVRQFVASVGLSAFRLVSQACLVSGRSQASHAYIILESADADGKYPLVLLVHGGPWARDSWGFKYVSP